MNADLDAFAAEVVGLHRRLVRVVLAVSGDRDVADECAQEALLRAWQRIRRGDGIDSLEAWCVTVALNLWRSQNRRAAYDRRRAERLGSQMTVDRSALPEHPEAADGFDDEVRRAVLSLPRRQREVVVLHYLLDLAVADVASVLGRSPGAVKNALHHARASLSAAITADREQLAVSDPGMAGPVEAGPMEEGR